MKKLIAFLAVGVCALAQTTTVQQTILGPDGQPASGTAFIRISAACKSGSDYVGNKTVASRFTAGAFSVSLVPNDTCAPSGTSYTVGWNITGGTQWSETWVVPTSASPVSVDSVKVSGTVPVPPAQINPSQISQAGATLNQELCWTGTQWAAGNCGGGGVASVFGRTGTVTAQSGDYSTSQVTESGNLYFTNARAQSAMAGLYQTPIVGAPGTWPAFATVATSGSYTNLSNTPTLPANTTSVAHQFFTAYNSTTGAFTQAALVSGDIPNNAANTSGTAANLSGTPALPNGTTATTQTQADNSTKLATTAYVDTGLGTKAASNASATVNSTTCTLGSSCTVTALSSGPSASAYNSVTQSVAQNTEVPVTFNTNEWDTCPSCTIHSTSVNPTRFTAPAAGKYEFACNVSINSSQSASLFFDINGSHASPLPAIAMTSSFGNTDMYLSKKLNLSANDYVECVVYIGTSASSTIAGQAWAQLTRIF